MAGDFLREEDFNEMEPVSLTGQQTWAKISKGLSVKGELLGRFPKRGKPDKFFYQVKLAIPAKGWKGAGEDREEITVPKGETLCIDETSALESLASLSPEHGSRYAVSIEVIDKIKLENGQTFWDFKLGKKKLG